MRTVVENGRKGGFKRKLFYRTTLNPIEWLVEIKTNCPTASSGNDRSDTRRTSVLNTGRSDTRVLESFLFDYIRGPLSTKIM